MPPMILLSNNDFTFVVNNRSKKLYINFAQRTKMVQPVTYDVLKQIALNDTAVHDNVEDLKYMFRNEIGSARNMHRINTMTDLIDCLERHDALSEWNIETLRQIADEFGGSLAAIIMSYQVPKAPQPYNEYREIRLAHECATRLQINDEINCLNSRREENFPQDSTNNSNQPEVFDQTINKEKRSTIYKLIAEEIGAGWRCLGRELEIRQGAIDNIEIQYRDLNTRVYKLFQAFEDDESIDPQQHLLIICRALDECRRKDLRRRVERIMSH